ncbi:mRNA 3'-end-processing protein rna14 [Paramarasmius palmivorus]|uniref:mRNA 3'-end-processing protein rna14 n=1 Tax=Paramarasmius palmivorus TaxID=297713 RepID=A0AAW0BED0_9AGAR
MWYTKYKGLTRLGDVDEALVKLREGIQGNNASLLLNFALAEVLEARGDISQVKQIHKELFIAFKEALSSE